MKTRKKVVDRLESIKDDVVINGSSFATKAIFYSQDPGSRSTGGKYTLNRKKTSNGERVERCCLQVKRR